jgi:4-amino-4-deoxy-L-arabinose transferase-like glycosyltransferase
VTALAALPRARLPRLDALAAPAVLAGALALRLSGLPETRTDPYYDAAVRSMGTSWHGLLFGAFEPGGSVAIDKPPVALWLQVASTKLLGFSSSALLLPGALAGSVAVLALFLLLRRLFGVAEALAGAAALAVLPVSVLTARSDTMDSIAVAITLCAALLVLRDTGWALAGAGALVGLAFAVKLFQALIPVPALVVLYVVATGRLARLAPAAGVAVAVGLCWLAVVTAAPGRLQPWALGSTDGTAVNATFLYDGVERLDASAAHLRNVTAEALAERPDPPGPLRLAGAGGSLDLRLGAELLPALIAGLAALALAARALPRRARAGALMLATWVGTGLVLFSAMNGLQVRYLEAFAPAVAGVLGVGVVTIARRLRAPRWAVAVAMAALLAVPFAESVEIARAGASDSGHIGAMPSGEVAALSRYLAAHDRRARYEVASATAVKAATLIAHDGRPVLMLDALARQPILPAARLEADIARGEVRYLLMTAGCRAGRCGPAVAWALRHGRDVTRRTGLRERGLLYALPVGPARTALRERAHRAAGRRPSAARALARSRARARSPRRPPARRRARSARRSAAGPRAPRPGLRR